MKLISLYIENFGGLHQYALDFEDGLTVIEEANGFGKTTLAEFIRAMFYGFPRKAKTLDKSRRQKYTPWNGGKFGGNLVFEVSGGRYRVERSFGATPKGDSFTLIDLATNKKSSRYSEELGLELFQLDADSFERSTYLPQFADGQVLTTDSIRSKLSNLVEDTNDVGNFEKAMAALRAKRSTFVPYRGSGGSVAQANSRVSQLQEQVRLAESQRDTLEETEKRIEVLKAQLTGLENSREQVRREIGRASEAAAVAAVHRQHRRLQEHVDQARQNVAQLQAQYPKLPEEKQLDEWSEAAANLGKLRHERSGMNPEPDDTARLGELAAYFALGLPDEASLEDKRKKLEKMQKLQQENAQLAADCAAHMPKKANPLPMILLILLGTAGVALGIVLLVRQVFLWGGISLGVGVLAVIGAVFAGVRLMLARELGASLLPEQEKIRSNEEMIGNLTQELTEFIRRYTEQELSAAVFEIRDNREDYLVLAAKQEALEEKQRALDVRIAAAEENLYQLLGGENFEERILALRLARQRLGMLLQELRRGQSELEDFAAEHGRELAETAAGADTDAAALQKEEAALTAQMNACSEELLRLQQRRELLRSQVQQIPQLQDELQQWQEKKNADQNKSDLLDDTMVLLEQAKENLSGSYLGPIRSSFQSFMEKLWGTQEGQILVTPDLDVQMERCGEARELGYFSAGETDTVMLCMRFALVDALFGKEKPFVILDDPFINLDDGRTAHGLELLQSLSKDRQIIYLTCNSSRSPK